MEMKFPGNYFVSFVQPSKIYRWRKQYTWPKLVMLFIFTIAFTFLPISLIFVSMTSFQLDMFIPQTMQLVDEKAVELIAPCTFTDAQMSCEPGVITTENGVVSVDPDFTYTLTGEGNNLQIAEAKNAIIFDTDSVILTDENGIGFQLQYPVSLTKLQLNSVDDLKAGLGELWYSQYRPVAVPVLMLAVLTMLFATVGIYVLFVAFVIYMMKFSRMVEIESFKEALAIVLVAIGLPTVLGAGVCLFTQDIAVLLTIQSFGMIGFLLVAYFRTRFREPHVMTTDYYEQALKQK